MNDVRRTIYITIILFLGVVVTWITTLFIFSCGLNFSCRQAAPKTDRTPIPTLIPVAHSESQAEQPVMVAFDKCQVSATDLIGAWVTAKSPETEPFPFSDVHGNSCEGTFAADIQPLFVENSLWYNGAIGCVSCHNSDLTERSAGLDLTAYDAIMLGTRRVAGASSAGSDIFGGGDWEKSLLHDVLVNKGLVAEGHSADTTATDVIVFAGSAAAAEATATPTP